jgi:hypothetical protein
MPNNLPGLHVRDRLSLAHWRWLVELPAVLSTSEQIGVRKGEI